MEWLGVLLLYLISGFMKKRQQNSKRREIESDPEWDSEKSFSENMEGSSNSLDQLLNDLFENNPKTPEPDPLIRKTVKSVNAKPLSKQEKNEIEESIRDENKEVLEEKIYHSKIADREEQHFGKKWQKKANIRRNLFNSKQAIKKSIIAKEVLDKPLALRK
tara:strand:+ start:1796 stop:2278 length:483 start_codon:yes stop_codon:yes gene_type:complete